MTTIETTLVVYYTAKLLWSLACEDLSIPNTWAALLFHPGKFQMLIFSFGPRNLKPQWPLSVENTSQAITKGFPNSAKINDLSRSRLLTLKRQHVFSHDTSKSFPWIILSYELMLYDDGARMHPYLITVPHDIRGFPSHPLQTTHLSLGQWSLQDSQCIADSNVTSDVLFFYLYLCNIHYYFHFSMMYESISGGIS